MWNYRVERWPRTPPLFSSLTSGNWKFERIRLWREVTTSSTTIIHLLDSGSSWILCKLAAISHIYWEERISVWSFHRKRLVFKCCPSFLLTFRNFSFFFFTGHGDKSSNYHLCAKPIDFFNWDWNEWDFYKVTRSWIFDFNFERVSIFRFLSLSLFIFWNNAVSGLES